MKKLLIVGSALLYSAVLSLNVQADAYIRGASQPWGEATNEAAMDAAFGAGNWDDLRMADGVAPFLPGAGHGFIFLEGGDSTALELNTYLNTNRTEIEAFVTAGGTLLLNSAPNQGGDIDFGFGGVTLLYGPSNTSDVVAADVNHTIFNGIATAYSGGSFGHALIGGGLNPLIIGAPGDGNAGETVLAEMAFGNGFVLFGGMTTTNFHAPQPDATTLRENIITYTAGAHIAAGPPEVVPTMSAYGLILTILGLLVVSGRRLRASAKRK